MTPRSGIATSPPDNSTNVPPIPPPRASGFTTTTPVPLYWCAYGAEGSDRLLVLHGGPGAHHDYLLPQMLELAKSHELIFYDQRGGGQSKTDDRTPITWQTQVEDLALVAAELGIDQPSLVGYSWGGLLALLYAIESAQRGERSPSRMVLIDPAPLTRQYRTQFEAEFARRQSAADVLALRTELAESGLRERDADAYRQRAFELSVAGYFADPAAARDLTQFRVTGRVQQSIWESLGDFDVVSQASTIECPVLVLHGDRDPIPIESSMDLARAIGVDVVVIEGSGHVPYVERPDALFPPIERFLQQTR